jgi:YbbR domain-containing protein
VRLIGDLASRLLQNGPRKLGALAVALVVWLFVASDTTVTVQRSLLVPIVVEGVTSEQVVVGLPQVAEVTVSGPTSRIDRLRPEGFEAVLDLSDVSGDFQAPVAVSSPQGIEVERVVPGEVIGIVENVVHAEVPVVPAVLGDLGPDQRSRVTVTPSVARVRGRSAVVNGVMAVVVPLPVGAALGGSTAMTAGYAVDGNGLPLAGVQVEPVAFELAWGIEPVWSLRRVPLEVAPPTAAGWALADDPPLEVTVVGRPAALAALPAVTADVDLPTGEVLEGRYNRVLSLRLPDGVIAAETPTVDLTYAAPSPPPD